MQAQGTVKKSYNEDDPVKNYCIKSSTPPHPVQVKLSEETMKHPRVRNAIKIFRKY